ncbi:MAG: hypothetical protein ACOX3U_00460 [Christensenellales bacterium]|jgi:hypothetical protein
MSNEPKRSISPVIIIAFAALIFGAVGLILKFIGIDIFGDIVQLMLFIVAAKMAYPITKDGKKFFKSFYKISYWTSIVVFGVFLVLPWIIDLVKFLKG